MSLERSTDKRQPAKMSRRSSGAKRPTAKWEILAGLDHRLLHEK
jgi:hypothetical protein